ncbi:hypothetical protein OG285_24985 [Streptomyces sp. NBC_01471]|uniref:hypothetical protein n=1 Tax=Streptomyces sp. NBC_01471 TaxID=2903879 RepID=UPI003254A7B6
MRHGASPPAAGDVECGAVAEERGEQSGGVAVGGAVRAAAVQRSDALATVADGERLAGAGMASAYSPRGVSTRRTTAAAWWS